MQESTIKSKSKRSWRRHSSNSIKKRKINFKNVKRMILHLIKKIMRIRKRI